MNLRKSVYHKQIFRNIFSKIATRGCSVVRRPYVVGVWGYAAIREYSAVGGEDPLNCTHCVLMAHQMLATSVHLP